MEERKDRRATREKAQEGRWRVRVRRVWLTPCPPPAERISESVSTPRKATRIERSTSTSRHRDIDASHELAPLAPADRRARRVQHVRRGHDGAPPQGRKRDPPRRRVRLGTQARRGLRPSPSRTCIRIRIRIRPSCTCPVPGPAPLIPRGPQEGLTETVRTWILQTAREWRAERARMTAKQRQEDDRENYVTYDHLSSMLKTVNAIF